MPHTAIRITFVDESAARQHWEAFGNGLANQIDNYARKRDGASHVLLLRDLSEGEAQRVAAWCGQQPDVAAVAPITESMFWSAPSHAV